MSYTMMLLVALSTSGSAASVTIELPQSRQDRLIRIAGERKGALVAEYSADEGNAWHPATIYNCDRIDKWRERSKRWNAGVLSGIVANGAHDCLWNYFFDVAMPRDRALLRFRSRSDGKIVQKQNIDLSGARDVVVIDQRGFAELAGGSLPEPWHLATGDRKKPAVRSLACEDEMAPPLTLKLDLGGWHRVYVGQEKMASFFLKFSKEPIQYEVPDFYGSANSWYDRPLREYYLRSVDMTGQDLVLAPGGTMYPKPAGLHHIRLVPVAADELRRWRSFRKAVEEQARPFAAYVEQCSAAFYFPKAVRMAKYTRGEMWHHKLRGATDAYVHVIRIGLKAWYHSDVVERCVFKEGEASEGWLKWTAWMEQGDPLAVAIDEGRAAGLRVFADLGMNRTHIGNPKEHYRVATEAQPIAHR